MKCKYEGTGIYEGRCYGTKEIDPCPGYDKCSQFKPNFKTNADHIRSMTDEELAEMFCKKYLCKTFGANACYGSAPICPAVKLCGSGHNGILEWLKQPKE